jgi:hypothetical protein
MKNLKSMPI